MSCLLLSRISLTYLIFIARLVLLYRLTYDLYLDIFVYVGCFSFLMNSLPLCRIDSSSPADIHASFLMYFLFGLIYFIGNALSKDCSYISINVLYDSFGQVFCITGKKSDLSRSSLNEERFDSENILFCFCEPDMQVFFS